MFGLDIYTLLVLWAATLSGTTIVGTGITWLVLQSKTRPTEQAKEQVKTQRQQQPPEVMKFENARQNLTAKLPDGETLIVSTVGGRVEELSIKEDPAKHVPHTWPNGWGTVYNAESTARRNKAFSRTRSKKMLHYDLLCQFGDEEFAEWFYQTFDNLLYTFIDGLTRQDIKSLELVKVDRRSKDEIYVDFRITLKPISRFCRPTIVINRFNVQQHCWPHALADTINRVIDSINPNP
jgi:hypothetical protein